MNIKFSILFLLCVMLLSFNSNLAAQSGISVMISPTSLSVPVGGERQMTAQVSGSANQSVTWTVNDIVGGNSTFGTITAAGKYVAPATIAAGTVTIKAVSAADNTASASCDVQVRNQIPYLTAVTPNPISLGSFSLTVTGSRFVPGAQIYFNNQVLPTNFVSSMQLTASGNVAQGGNAQIKVANPGNVFSSTSLNLSVVSTVLVKVSPVSANLPVGGTQQFSATVANSPNTAVVWAVNGIAGGNQSVGTIDASGLYTAPAVLPFAGAVSITATSAADGVTKASATVILNDPQALTINRFLDQATFGATPQLTAHVKQVGFNAFLDEQFAAPESQYPNISTATTGQVVDRFWINAFKGNDQLRQRTVYALSQIWVTALNKNPYANQTIPWLQILSRNAFGNYRQLMKEMTLDSSMASYLDLANSFKAANGNAPNENYARELMQLFTIGLYETNPDGSYKLDVFGQKIPTYDQQDVRQLALAFTGWTYPTPPGQTPRAAGNPNYYPGAMEARPALHDATQKILFHDKSYQRVLPPNQTIQQDLDMALDAIFAHPNLAPFVSVRLIRALVTSNPSPDYIARVSSVFEDNGQGVRGDIQAVIRAILLDPEARSDNPPADFGRLRSPFQHTIAVFRALNANVNEPLNFGWEYVGMGEKMLDAPSVFGHYSPLFRLSNGQPAPEFQIYTPTEAVNRANFLYQVLNANGYPNMIDLTPFMNIATDPVQLTNAVDNRLLYGRMTTSTRASILKALQSTTDARTRVLTVLYLVATSGEFLVQR